MNERYDAIVIGLGGMGSAAAWHLAQRGQRVLGLEQFGPGHDQGSSHGHTRIIRQAYFEHPDYVPLVRRAYEGWYDLEQRQGQPLLTLCPCLTLGPTAGELISGVRRSAVEHRLPVEELSVAEVRRRFPAFNAPDDAVGLVEQSAGFLFVERCVLAMAEQARQRGAILRYQEAVVRWSCVSGDAVVETTQGRYSATKLVLTAGPWAGRFLGAVGHPLRVMRQVALWFPTSRLDLFRRDRFPLFIADTPGGYYYGLPALDERGPKIARHYGANEQPGPEAIDRSVTDADERDVRVFLRGYLPAADGPRRSASVCIYTLTPDRHFLLGIHPEEPRVIVAAGFSGHGFKFAPVIGEVVADLVERGRTEQPIGLFRPDRFAADKG